MTGALISMALGASATVAIMHFAGLRVHPMAHGFVIGLCVAALAAVWEGRAQ
jgi:hypothetical protein